MESQPNPSPVHRYFAGLAESTFQTELGVVDTPMVDYVSDLLVRFIRSDVVHQIRGVTGRRLMTVGEMAGEASKRLGEAKRKLHLHIGDFTLFWAGVYPEALRKESDNQFGDYCSHGKRSYRIASCIEPATHDEPEADVLERLSERFELCCYGLREIRRQWEEGDDELYGPGSILLN